MSTFHPGHWYTGDPPDEGEYNVTLEYEGRRRTTTSEWNNFTKWDTEGKVLAWSPLLDPYQDRIERRILWFTPNRPPTEDDADVHGQVIVQLGPTSGADGWIGMQNWNHLDHHVMYWASKKGVMP